MFAYRNVCLSRDDALRYFGPGFDGADFGSPCGNPIVQPDLSRPICCTTVGIRLVAVPSADARKPDRRGSWLWPKGPVLIHARPYDPGNLLAAVSAQFGFEGASRWRKPRAGEVWMLLSMNCVMALGSRSDGCLARRPIRGQRCSLIVLPWLDRRCCRSTVLGTVFLAFA